MRKIFVFTFILIGSLTKIFPQSMNSIYFLNDWSQRHTLNASYAPENGHFSLPFVGGVNLNIESNTGLSNFTYPYNNELVTFMHSSVNGLDFIEKLEPNIYFRQGLKINLLSFGVFSKNAHWTFDYNLKEQLNINLPIDLFRLTKLGFEHETNRYDLKNLSINQSNFGEFSVGYSREINSKIRVGANLKLLVGLSSESVTYKQFDVLLSNDRYEIYAVGESYIMSDIISLNTNEENNYDFSTLNINYSSKKPAGTGGAINLGITYKPTKKLSFAAALNDLGFIYWNNATINKGIANTNFVFNGFTVLDSLINIESQLQQIEQDAYNLILFQKQSASTSGMLNSVPSTLNLSAEYSLTGNNERDIRFGLLFNSYNSSAYHSNQLMGAVTFKPLSWFSLSTTYSIFINESNRLGVAFNFSPEWMNVFVAADLSTLKFNRQLLPLNEFNLNLQAGFSLYLGE